MLTNLWVPLPTYKFPMELKNEKRGLKFQYKWLLEFNWLAYSEKNVGAYCKHCVVFSKTGGVGNQPLRKLVIEAFNAWKKALEVILLEKCLILVINLYFNYYFRYSVNILIAAIMYHLYLIQIILLTFIQKNNHQ